MRLLAAIGVLAIAGVIAALVFFFGGFYNVAASDQDHPVVVWALQTVRNASIARHAGRAEPPMPLDDKAAQAGARAFNERGCVNCHGAPGADWAKYSEGMQPGPPELKEVAGLEPAQLFWVIKNGINMTGMPAFSATDIPDQEVWTIVAFIKRLPKVTPSDFKAWTAGPAPGAGEK